MRYPWVLQHAKEAAPQIAWDAPSFRAVVDHVAGVWGASQAITALLCVVRSASGIKYFDDGEAKTDESIHTSGAIHAGELGNESA